MRIRGQNPRVFRSEGPDVAVMTFCVKQGEDLKDDRARLTDLLRDIADWVASDDDIQAVHDIAISPNDPDSVWVARAYYTVDTE